MEVASQAVNGGSAAASGVHVEQQAEQELLVDLTSDCAEQLSTSGSRVEELTAGRVTELAEHEVTPTGEPSDPGEVEATTMSGSISAERVTIEPSPFVTAMCKALLSSQETTTAATGSDNWSRGLYGEPFKGNQALFYVEVSLRALNEEDDRQDWEEQLKRGRPLSGDERSRTITQPSSSGQKRVLLIDPGAGVTTATRAFARKLGIWNAPLPYDVVLNDF